MHFREVFNDQYNSPTWTALILKKTNGELTLGMSLFTFFNKTAFPTEFSYCLYGCLCRETVTGCWQGTAKYYVRQYPQILTRHVPQKKEKKVPSTIRCVNFIFK